MPRINIFFAVPAVQLCGVTTFTAHLFKAFELAGYEPVLFKIRRSARGNDTRSTAFPLGLTIHTVEPHVAMIMAQHDPSIISYAFWPKCGEYALPLMEAGVPLVVHDPAEFLPPAIAAMRSTSAPVIAIRKTNVAGLAKLGVAATYIPHPYTPSAVLPVVRDLNGVCLARVDGRKRTEMIVAANEMLPPSEAIHIYGNINRIYEFHVLRKKHPDWRKWYGGQFPSHWGSAVELASRAEYSVDMTGLVGDGGGTQYTFFESWNAGTPLVLNREWLAYDGACKEGVNCLAAGSAEELAAVMRAPATDHAAIVAGGYATMNQHIPNAVVPIYQEVCKWSTK